MDITCPRCGEAEELRGDRSDDGVVVTCLSCGHRWQRDLTPSCPTCRGSDLQLVPLAILERARGTQLSVVGTRPIHLCYQCDADDIARWHRNRPNPLMPVEIPTIGSLEEQEHSANRPQSEQESDRESDRESGQVR